MDGLVALGSHALPCTVHGRDHVELFTARTSFSDTDIDCREGRQIVFAEPSAISGLDLTDATRALFQSVLAAHPPEHEHGGSSVEATVGLATTRTEP